MKLAKVVKILSTVFVLGAACCMHLAASASDVASNKPEASTTAFPERHGQVSQQLFLGTGKKQALIVGLGGSEGGNPWASNYWKPQRDRFIEQGYAVLALGYFATKESPAKLDRIALEGIHAAVMQASQTPGVNAECIIVMGGSRGGELALLLGSHYKEYDAVVGIVAGSSIFPALTMSMDTPGWSHNGNLFPFVPVNEASYPALLRRDLRAAFSAMMEDHQAMEKAAIAVEEINGPVMFLSAQKDEMWPSTEMSDMMVKRLKAKNFSFPVRHVAINGDHSAPLKHFERIEEFLENELRVTKPECAK